MNLTENLNEVEDGFQRKSQLSVFVGRNISPILCNSFVDHILQSNTSILQTGISFWFVTKVIILVDDLVMKLETMSVQTEILEQFNSEEN